MVTDTTDTPDTALDSIHEHGVHGSVLAQTRSMVEAYLRPGVTTATEPTTNIEVPVVVDKDGVHALPESIFDQYRLTPKRREGIATLTSIDSFVAHINRFKDDDSLVFACDDRVKPSMTAVLDYHRSGAKADPRFGRHRSSFAFPLADEWKAWVAANGKTMEMREFAAFLEDRIIDVMPGTMISLSDEQKRFVDTLGGQDRIADPAKLMQLATELKVLESSTVNEARNLTSGEATVEFSTQHETHVANQKVTIPAMFVIGVPVFNNGPVYSIIARFRYRKNGPKVVFWYDLWRTDKVFDHAFTEAVDTVREETGLPVLLGAPEGSQPATQPGNW